MSLSDMAAHVVARYYWVRKLMAYPMVGLPGWVLMWFWLRHQSALALRSQGVWSGLPDFAKWQLGWALSIITFLATAPASWWFKASTWAWKKGDFWGMD